MAEAEEKQKSWEFLEDVIHNAPLYSSRTFDGDIHQSSFKNLSNTNFYCHGSCDSEQTFKPSLVTAVGATHWESDRMNLTDVTKRDFNGASSTLVADGELFDVYYKCAKCQIYAYGFMLKIARNGNSGKRIFTVHKVGQDPTTEQPIDKELKTWLSKDDAVLFQKGLRTEANGFGIAAYSYYRRIVEGNVEKLLGEISAHSDSNELKTAITDALKQKNAADRIKLVKDHAPASLKPGGKNVFSVLYKALSKGIHSRSDEDCLKDATDIKICLMFLIKRINREKQEAAELSKAMKALSKAN
jgi:hypothetical protein